MENAQKEYRELLSKYVQIATAEGMAESGSAVQRRFDSGKCNHKPKSVRLQERKSTYCSAI